MSNSKALQSVLIRARAEALKAGYPTAQPEHVYLAILHVSHLSADKIAPSSSAHAEIDAEIARVNELLLARGIDAAEAESALRKALVAAKLDGNATEEMNSLLERAASDGDPITTDAMLRALLDAPTPTLKQALAAICAHTDDDGDDETVPFFAQDDEADLAKKQPTGSSDSNSAIPKGKRTGGNTEPHADERDGGQTADQKQDGKDHGGSDTLAGFVMPKMPDPSEFDPSVINVGADDDSQRAPKDGDIIDVGDDEDEPNDDAHGSTPKPGGKKPLDFAGIMRELREKRERGQSGADDDDDGKGGDNAPADTPDDKPADTPDEAPKPGGKKPIDFVDIMRELREKRERGQGGTDDDDGEGGDNASTDARDSKPADTPDEAPKPNGKGPADFVDIMRELREKREHGQGGTDDDDDVGMDAGDGSGHTPDDALDAPKDDGIDLGQIMHELREKRERRSSAPPHEDTDDFGTPKRDESRIVTPQKITKLNGIPFRGGTAWAATQYFLLAISMGLSAFILHAALCTYIPSYNLRFSMPGYGLVFILLCVLVLFGITALIKRKYEAFGLFLNCIGVLFAIAIISDGVIKLSRFDMVTGWRATVSELIILLLLDACIFFYSRRIRQLPNKRGINVSAFFSFAGVKGSPDKVFFEGTLGSLLVPLAVVFICRIQNVPIPPLAQLYFSLVVWNIIVDIPRNVARLYPEDDESCTTSERKKRYAATAWMTILAILLIPWVLLSLAFIYGWLPFPTWLIIVLGISGALCVLLIIATIFVYKQKAKEG